MRKINWENYALIAYGLLGWMPSDFWGATPVDFNVAYGAWKQVNGVGIEESPLDREKLNEMIIMWDKY